MLIPPQSHRYKRDKNSPENLDFDALTEEYAMVSDNSVNYPKI